MEGRPGKALPVRVHPMNIQLPGTRNGSLNNSAIYSSGSHWPDAATVKINGRQPSTISAALLTVPSRVTVTAKGEPHTGFVLGAVDPTTGTVDTSAIKQAAPENTVQLSHHSLPEGTIHYFDNNGDFSRTFDVNTTRMLDTPSKHQSATYMHEEALKAEETKRSTEKKGVFYCVSPDSHLAPFIKSTLGIEVTTPKMRPPELQFTQDQRKRLVDAMDASHQNHSVKTDIAIVSTHPLKSDPLFTLHFDNHSAVTHFPDHTDVADGPEMSVHMGGHYVADEEDEERAMDGKNEDEDDD